MRVVFRILGTLLVGLVLLFAWPASGSAESPRVSGHPHVYAYDSELHPGRTLDIQTGGGPPATTYDRVATPAVAGHVSDGPQVRPETLIAYGYTTYDQPAKLAQFDGRGTTAVGPVEVLDGDPPSPPAGLIAAETGAARGGVYSLRDEAGNVVRTGRTKDLAARESSHFNDPVLGDFQFNTEYRTDVYAEQRGLEQMLYDRYPGAQAANGGFNKIRGISRSNPNLDVYMQSGWGFLERMGLG